MSDPAEITITAPQRLLLQAVARRSMEGGGKRPGWCVVFREVPPRWSWDDWKAVRRLGLVDYFEEWKHDFARLTDAGYAVLSRGGSDA